MTGDVSTFAPPELKVIGPSQVGCGEARWALARTRGRRELVVRAPRDAPILSRLDGRAEEDQGDLLLVGPTNARNAALLRGRFPWLAPRLLGTATSAGLGDRLGLATPGHVRAMRSAGRGIEPVFAQQSMRELARTGRTPQRVMDDAMWGVFEEGWTSGFGADADHLKEPEDINRALAAGFTLFTIDPGAQVDALATTLSGVGLEHALDALPWAELEDSFAGVRRRFLGRPLPCEGLTVEFDDITLARAAVKYGRAVAHVATLYRHLVGAAGRRPFELEVSVDETDEPTSHAEHAYLATELARLGVRWVGLAPRFVGRFEKGVDYIGDLEAFERHFAGHAAIARTLGPVQDQPPLRVRQVQRLPDRGQARRRARAREDGRHELPRSAPDRRQLGAGVLPGGLRLRPGRYEEDRESYHVSARLDRRARSGRPARPGPRCAPRRLPRAPDPARDVRLGPDRGQRGGRSRCSESA